MPLTAEGDRAMSLNEGNPVKVPLWLHLVFVVLAMLLVYRLTVWSEVEVRDEQYYQQSMPPADVAKQFAQGVLGGESDPAAAVARFVADNVTTNLGQGREAVLQYFSGLGSDINLVAVASSDSKAYLHYEVQGKTRLDVLTIDKGQVIEFSSLALTDSAN